jgi:hypothetical protein
MPVINPGNLPPSSIFGQVISALKAHRSALEVLNNQYEWISGLTVADLEAAPINMSATDAQALMNALADAHAEYLIHTSGFPPATYPQPPNSYNYSASQNAIIGPN